MMLPGMAAPSVDTPMYRALQVVRRTLRSVFFFSFFVNLLALISSVYMLQVYDRVLASRSLPTLVYLTLFAAGCLAALAALEVVRSRLLVRMGVRFDAQLSGLAFTNTLQAGRPTRALRDVDQVRTFFSGPTILSLLDAPWMPVYIGLVYLLHSWLGHVALSGGLILIALALWNERSTRTPLMEATRELHASGQFAEMSSRNTEVVRAMGMLPALTRIWRRRHDLGLGLQAVASDKAANVSALAKAWRLFLQIAILGVGAWLVIRQESTAGVMIAASIVMGRALQPVEAAIGGWRSFLAARESYKRMSAEFGTQQDEPEAMPLPKPLGALVFDKVSAGPPEARRLTVQDLSFSLTPSTCLGITGPSAAGKSTLARLAVGVWRPTVGSVRLDGASLADWKREDVGPHIGYLPQDIEIFPGSVASNIARFGEIDSQKVVDAAQLAGAHAMILGLPQGYETLVGPDGANLSGGQRQRIGLARAFHGCPPLIVLDEPTSNLDAEGEASVRQAMEELKRRKSTVIVIAHRPALLGGTDQLMVIVNGRIASVGPTAEIMPAITRRVIAPADAGSRATGLATQGSSRD